MGCCGGDREKGPVSEEQKWDYITLDDFKSKGCLTPFSYAWLWILIIIAIGVYAADTFTAIQLLAFNRWSSEVQPAIPFSVSKWIFAVCIIISVVLLAYESLRALRVVQRGGVADSYLDPIAVIWQSIRPGSGRGWRRFLVFAELTKSKKGVDYTALFVYFQFKGALRIVLAEGPRQVINGITLYSVFRLNLLPDGKNAPTDGHSGIQQFWQNLEVLADKDKKQAVILASMLFTLVIWVITAILLLIAIVLYILFLWHYIPSADGSLTRYCRRKIDSRLDSIVSKKTRKALEKQEAKRRKEERKAMKNGETFAKPTLPDLDDDKDSFISRTETMSSKPTLARTDTSFTNASTPTIPQMTRQPTLPDVSGRPAPSRSATGSSYASNAPLLTNTGGMGYSDEPVPTLPTPISAASERDYFSSPSDYHPGPPSRSLTGSTQRSYGPPSGTPGPYGPNGPITRPPTAQSRRGPTPGPPALQRVQTSETMNSNFSRRAPGTGPVTPISPFNDPRDSPPEYFGPSYEMSPVRTSPPGGTPMGAVYDYQRPPTRTGPSPAPSFASAPGSRPPPRSIPERSGTAPPRPSATPAPANGGYVAFNPNMHAPAAPPSSGTPAPPPIRNFSSPVHAAPRANTAQDFEAPTRSFTSPVMPRLPEGPTGRSGTAPGGYGGAEW
ncbi:hypothetical protein NA57DRAFT_76518 [Rhizodiscina lignyota]|uniref:Vacuolar membrane protein n=1 Tax=Rhizodiscina lignyota TaxID=1504668 RepID=A0A9P4M568_9PEZI|nr:hypothetical protein NA57DRAFT_76518 [Rhizodiscina lignyota]